MNGNVSIILCLNLANLLLLLVLEFEVRVEEWSVVPSKSASDCDHTPVLSE